MAELPNTFLDRFVVAENGCWLWTAAKTNGGYGRFPWRCKTVLAHRFAYETLVGRIPDGLHIDHLCRQRDCVNPAHMEPVTQWENTRRGLAPSALNAVKTHCQRGHALVEGNIYHKTFRGRPVRQCRQCTLDDTVARRVRLRAAGLTTKGRAYRYAAYLSK